MSIISIPSTVIQRIGGMTIGQQRFDIAEQSAESGHTAVRLGAPPRWIASIASPDVVEGVHAAAWRALVVGLRGRVNHLALYDITNPQPRGTARGTMTLASSAAVGATSLSITGATALGTLEAGDWLQAGTGVGSLYCMVTELATADGSGNITVNIEPPVRAAISSGTAVAWNRPLCHYKLRGDSVSWNARGWPGFAGGFSLDLIEDWNA